LGARTWTQFWEDRVEPQQASTLNFLEISLKEAFLESFFEKKFSASQGQDGRGQRQREESRGVLFAVNEC
jgi:hypothetical protein